MTVRPTPTWLPGQAAIVDDRLALAGLFNPSPTSLLGRGGLLAGKGLIASNGGSSLVSNVTATTFDLAGFRCLVPGTVNALQGAYLCTNDDTATVTMTYASASTTQYRRDLLIAEVLDADYGGGTGNYLWRLRVVQGTNAASSGVATRPATPANSLAIMELYIAPNSSAAFTLLSGYTVALGGIRPAFPGDTSSGAYLGEYRDLSTKGLQRWDSTGWMTQNGFVSVNGNGAASQSLPNAAQTIVALPNAEQIDSEFFTLNTTTGVVTVQRTYWYQVAGFVVINGAAAAGRRFCMIFVNGAQRGDAQMGIYWPLGNSSALGTSPRMMKLNSGDTVAVAAYQDSGSATSIDRSTTGSNFSILALHP